MSNREQRLREILTSLPEMEAESLLDYAEFLLIRAPQKQLLQTLSAAGASGAASSSTLPGSLAVIEPDIDIDIEPADIPRPETETIIGAVKRLSETYHMLSKDKMLHETADLVGQSMMGTRDTAEVIDDLEQVFRRYYDKQFGLTDPS